MIKAIDASTLRANLADVMREVEANRDYVLVTRKHKPVSVVANLDFFEDLLALASPAYRKSIREARQDYRRGRTFSHEEVFGKL